jgi:hypothetical protein
MTENTFRKRLKSRKSEQRPSRVVEYYQVPFLLLHRDLGLDEGRLLQPHIIRSYYWNLVPDGEYHPNIGRRFVLEYAAAIESDLAKEIKQHSLTYWLHAYRRLSPSPPAKDSAPTTIGIVRYTMEAAIQKYAPFPFCSAVAFSNEVPVEKILRGRLMDERFAHFREVLPLRAELVLTDFGVDELRQLYMCEKLAYELWRCGATLRILAKGAPLIVDHASEKLFFDNRDDVLHELVTHYDNRARLGGTSSTGTTYPDEKDNLSHEGTAFVPVYNVENIPVATYARMLEWFGVGAAPDEPGFTNFLWQPMNLRGYFEAHLPFREVFFEKHNVSLESVLIVVATLLWRVFYLWQQEPTSVIHFWQRAYEGPASRIRTIAMLREFIPFGIKVLGAQLKEEEVEIEAAVSFLELTEHKRQTINLLTGGPHHIFLPANDDRYFIDLAWVDRTLYYLFFDLQMGDQNFKGDALEKVVRKGKAVLPVGKLTSLNNQSRQVDASFAIGETLVIAECRAFARSFGIETGDRKSYEYRAARIVKALEDSDEKAEWLCRNPLGKNYDIRGFSNILPIAITPFIEYIHSNHSFYWLSETLPRVLSPTEARAAMDDGTLKDIIKRSPHARPILVARGDSNSA